MAVEHQAQGPPALDEGSWAYLIGATEGSQEGVGLLRERVIEACEASGWSAVSWSPAEAQPHLDPGYFFEGMRHAVEHADLVVALLGASAGSVDAELAMAYGHRRPIVGICPPGKRTNISQAQAMLMSYERARVIDCADVDRCATELCKVLSDPDFAASIHTAARENAEDA